MEPVEATRSATALLLLAAAWWVSDCGGSSPRAVPDTSSVDVARAAADGYWTDLRQDTPDGRPGDGGRAREASRLPGDADVGPEERIPHKVNLASDANRDGTTAFDDSDEKGEDDWSLEQGAVFLVNGDDDDGDGLPDLADGVVNGPADVKDLALLLVEPMPWLAAGGGATLSWSAESLAFVRVFRQRGEEWEEAPGGLIELTGEEVSEEPVALGLEGLAWGGGGAWNGRVVVTLEVSDEAGGLVGDDVVEFNCAPFLLVSSLNPASKIVTAYSEPAQTAFVQSLEAVAEALDCQLSKVGDLGHQLSASAVGDLWIRDAVETGFAVLPRGKNHHLVHYALSASRLMPLDEVPAAVLLAPDVGVLTLGLDGGPASPHLWFANLELSPVLLANEMYFPYGRVYVGHDPGNPERGPRPEVLAFVEAQQLQAPIVYVDTSWLASGLVSELMTWIPYTGDPGCCGKGFRLLVADAQAGLQLLWDMESEGQSDALLLAGTDLERTVSQFLADQELVAFNEAAQVHLTAVRKHLLEEFDLEDEEVVGLPVLYEPEPTAPTRARSLLPNPLNALVLGKAYITADPRGPQVKGTDLFAAAIEERLEPFNVVVEFIDTWAPYHEAGGGVHRATVGLRQPPNREWWLWYM